MNTISKLQIKEKWQWKREECKTGNEIIAYYGK